MNRCDPYDVLILTTTSDDRTVLERIARTLVEKNLAACVQVSGPIQSTYRWKDEICTSDEWICTIKTTGMHFRSVEIQVRELHNYDQPQLVGAAADAGSDGYLAWVMEQVQ